MGNPPFEILEHTADVGLRAYGRTLPELFTNAAWGMIALALEPMKSDDPPQGVAEQPAECRKLSARGEDLEDVIVHFLSEILYLLDTEGWRFSEFRIQTLAANGIEAEAWGSRKELPQHRRVAVKAVTYHQVSVQESDGGWTAVVYFDI